MSSSCRVRVPVRVQVAVSVGVRVAFSVRVRVTFKCSSSSCILEFELLLELFFQS